MADAPEAAMSLIPRCRTLPPASTPLAPAGWTVAIVAIVLTGAVAAGARDPIPAEPPASGADALSLDQYYGDAVSHIGSFPGRLVCVSTERSQIPENAVSCGDDKVYALSITTPAAVVPIIGSSKAAADHLPSLLNQEVVVRGKHYPDKGVIAAASIESAHTAADAPAEPRRPH